MRIEMQSDPAGCRLILHFSEGEHAEANSVARAEGQWRPALLERVQASGVLGTLAQSDRALVESRDELQALQAMTAKLHHERRCSLERGDAYAAIEKKLGATVSHAETVRSRAAELEQIHTQRVAEAVREIDNQAVALIDEKYEEIQGQLAGILAALDEHQSLFLRYLTLRRLGEYRGRQLHAFRDQLRNGKGPEILQELLATPFPAAESVADAAALAAP